MRKFIIQPEFTNNCNYRCRFCPHSVYQQKSEGGNQFNRKKGFMSDELFNIVLENVEKYAKSVTLGFFGEQVLHPRFDDFIKSFPSDRSYELTLNTNWSLVTQKNMDALKHLDQLRISLDACSPEIYEKMRPVGQVLDLRGRTSKRRLDALNEKTEHWLSLPDHPPTRLVYVISSINKSETKKFIERWKTKIGAHDQILTKSVLSYGGVMRDTTMKPNNCKVAGKNWFTIAWNGDCSPCNLDVNIDLKVGNLLEERDMMKIIKGEKWGEVMSRITQNSGICANCFDANRISKNMVTIGKRDIKSSFSNLLKKL